MFLKPEECSKYFLWADSCWERPRDREQRSEGGLGDIAGDGCFVARHTHSPCVTPPARAGPRIEDTAVWGQHRSCPPLRIEAACAPHAPRRAPPHSAQPHTLPCMAPQSMTPHPVPSGPIAQDPTPCTIRPYTLWPRTAQPHSPRPQQHSPVLPSPLHVPGPKCRSHS